MSSGDLQRLQETTGKVGLTSKEKLEIKNALMDYMRAVPRAAGYFERLEALEKSIASPIYYMFRKSMALAASTPAGTVAAVRRLFRGARPQDEAKAIK